jgi:hypothetical protein
MFPRLFISSFKKGLVNIPARLIFGFLADKRLIAAIHLNTAATAVATASLFVYFLLDTFTLQLVFSVVFAIGIGIENFL